ncbi:MAG: malto-oligosyltrehalose synthase [Deltaproteobacteria bacterium]
MTATYRLQLHAGFTFEHARSLVPYLAELGITHLYLSPILQAAAGSTHGYDVVDSHRVSVELGGEAGFLALVADAKQRGLAILLDIVPNHMSIAGTGNAWWMDVLANGPASYYAHYFDVDWSGSADRVTLPVLGERYGRALATGLLGVIYDEAGFAVRAGDARYPIAPESLGEIVRRAGEKARVAELAFVGDALAALPRATQVEARRRRHRDQNVLAARLAELGHQPACKAALEAEIAAVNADKVELDSLLEAQAYRLVHWSVATSELSYRRFFDINTLVGLRTEEPDVFEERHAKVLEWLADGTIAGVRIDHVDGLRDPGQYLTRLRERAPDAWIVVEKILIGEECLPAWPIDGTTGYDFAEKMGTLLVAPAAEAPLTAAFEAYTGTTFDAAAAKRLARRQVASSTLHSEMSRLVELASRACASSPATRDYTRAEIASALVEIVAGYPVYRTYIGEREQPAAFEVRPPIVIDVAALAARSPTDQAMALATTDLHIVATAASGAEHGLAVLQAGGQMTARHLVPALGLRPASPPPSLADGSQRLVLDHSQAELDRERISQAARAAVDAGADPDLVAFLELALAGELAHPDARALARATQQVTGAIVAKGDEDTASYRLVRLASRCEVGAELATFARPPNDIHRVLACGGAKALLATATHDTKRGEDVRARLAVLTEATDEWAAFVERWRERSDRHWGDVAPDRTFEYLMWQTFVGAWPLEADRAVQYAQKAAREAKLRTTWTAPDKQYEEAMERWVRGVLADNDLCGELATFVARLAPRARASSLAQLLVKLCAPGVPDFYQGCELADFSLVDPDNRRPVDYDVRRAALHTVRGGEIGDDLGYAKLWTIYRTLTLRRDRPALFDAPYTPLTPAGPCPERAFVFSRGADLIVAVPRAGTIDPETVLELPPGSWCNVLTDERVHGGVADDRFTGAVMLATLWAKFPVALLVRRG